MTTLVFIVFALHLLWLWGCVHYCIFIYLQNNQGHSKNPYLKDNRLKVIFATVVTWFFYIIFLTYEFYSTYSEKIWEYDSLLQFLFTNKLSLELLNIGSTIVVTLFLLGYKFGDK